MSWSLPQLPSLRTVSALIWLCVLVTSRASASSVEDSSDAEEESPSTLETLEATGRLPLAEDEETKTVCQICPRPGIGLRLEVPLSVPLVNLKSSADGSEGERPQYLSFNSGLKFAFLGQLGLRLGPVELEALGAGLGLGSHPVLSIENNDTELGSIELRAFLTQGLLRWRIPPLALGSSPEAPLLALWPHAGARYLRVHGDASDNKERLLLDTNLSWVDPFMGWEAIVDFQKAWTFRVNADIGGFTIGSDISVWSQARAEYHFSSWFGLWGGWFLYYSRTTPKNRLTRLIFDELELSVSGPSIGVTFQLL